MSGNVKFRFLLAPIVLALLVGISPVVAWAGELELLQEVLRMIPQDPISHSNLGIYYRKSGQYQKAIASHKEAIRIKPDYASAHFNLGLAYGNAGQYEEAIASYK